MAGWIKIQRDITRHWLSQDMERLGRWLDLLCLANFEDGRVLVGSNLIELKRGQLATSFSFLAERWKCSKSTASKFVELLESDGMVERSTERRATILTICNYDSYQQKENESRTITEQLPNDCRTIAERNKEEKEEKEIINNNISNAHTREEKTPWVSSVERGYCERFKAQGCGITMSRATGLKAAEIMALLDVFMAKCELRNQGHKDFEHFNNRFLWAVQNNKLSIPKQEQPSRKITSNEDTYKLMQQMGWQNS